MTRVTCVQSSMFLQKILGCKLLSAIVAIPEFGIMTLHVCLILTNLGKSLQICQLELFGNLCPNFKQMKALCLENEKKSTMWCKISLRGIVIVQIKLNDVCFVQEVAG